MKKYLLFILGLLAFLAGFLINRNNENVAWIAVYPPPPEEMFLEATPFLLWFVGAVLVIVGIAMIFRKKET